MMRLNSQTWRTCQPKLFLKRRGTWRAGCVERCLSGSGGGGWCSRRKPTPGLLPHRLHQLLMRSRSAQLLAVRRVSQDNQGKKTAGIDGIKSLTPAERLTLVEAIHPRHQRKRKAQPVRRIWIPKPGKQEKRPLGIPVMYDRACQALAKQALEPEWEARFEATSYGFRPGRGSHDAIGAIFNEIRYADDFVALHPSRAGVEKARQVIELWLTGIGLELKPSKTRITHTLEGEAGFDFLGLNVRQP